MGHVSQGARLSGWVIDGASPLVKKGRIFGSSSRDVEWFVQKLGAYLRENSLRVTEPKVLFQQAIESVYSAYFALIPKGREMPLYECPLAAVSWVRIDFSAQRAKVEYLSLGDCPLFLMGADRSMRLQLIGDLAAERTVRSKVGSALKNGARKGRSAELTEHLRSRRTQQHREPSTGVFALNPAAVDHAVSGISEIEGDFDVVIATDGLFRLVDLFGRQSISEFCALCGTGDFEPLLRELRTLENEPMSLHRYPRLKRHDDASGLLFRCRNGRSIQ